jgi:hypothetical protein
MEGKTRCLVSSLRMTLWLAGWWLAKLEPGTDSPLTAKKTTDAIGNNLKL